MVAGKGAGSDAADGSFPGHPDQVVLRGGGWGNNPYGLRAAYRHGNPPDIGLEMVGFRCAGDL
jgi:formylglycine-generating enzyme required for sulfatase activity